MLIDELVCEAKLADLERAIEAEHVRRQFERSTPIHSTTARPAVRRWLFRARRVAEATDH